MNDPAKAWTTMLWLLFGNESSVLEKRGETP
jgi:hypothetical protein